MKMRTFNQEMSYIYIKNENLLKWKTVKNIEKNKAQTF